MLIWATPSSHPYKNELGTRKRSFSLPWWPDLGRERIRRAFLGLGKSRISCRQLRFQCSGPKKNKARRDITYIISCLSTWTLDPAGGHWPLPSFMVSISTPMVVRWSKYLKRLSLFNRMFSSYCTLFFQSSLYRVKNIVPELFHNERKWEYVAKGRKVKKALECWIELLD